MEHVATTADDILRRPYVRFLIPDSETGTYTAEILEFQGCRAQGRTVDEAYANLESVAREWIRVVLESRQPIPEPSLPGGYSGKVALRLPRSLHRQAALFAERDRVSLHQYLVATIAEKIGSTNATRRTSALLSKALRAFWSMQVKSVASPRGWVQVQEPFGASAGWAGTTMLLSEAEKAIQ